MIQRIQTVYLMFALLISAGLIFVFPLWVDAQSIDIYAQDQLAVFGGFLVSSALSFISILSFKNRKRQFVLGRLNIILNFILLAFFVYVSLNLSGEIQVSEKGIGMLIPVISIVCLALANKAIKKDEDLVKSVDRLR
ncbi:DUF4293 domain-containing protein [Winogradskyella aurantiaca]|uniref:DUF4293 domain-containing protein n=1 Tax=Winogradskyella aurantiaca TaxID=2219558 RepID=UPI000E1C77E3|nr:DUF4293 domain-containing protein [Winogradskyella aurantiaca]